MERNLKKFSRGEPKYYGPDYDPCLISNPALCAIYDRLSAELRRQREHDIAAPDAVLSELDYALCTISDILVQRVRDCCAAEFDLPETEV